MSFKSLYRLSLTLTAISVLGLGAAKPASASSLSYSITDLGILPGGSQSIPNSINNSSQIVGFSDTASGANHAFLYNNGTRTDLGTLPGDYTSYAESINNSGMVVGYSSTSSSTSNAFLYDNGTMYNLNNLLPANSGWNLQQANAINDSGQIVGYGSFNGEGRAFLLTPNVAAVPEPDLAPGLLAFSALGAGALGRQSRNKTWIKLI